MILIQSQSYVKTAVIRWFVLSICLLMPAMLAALPAVATPAHNMCRLDKLSSCELSSQWHGILNSLWPGTWQQSLTRAVAGQGGVTLLSETDALILLNPDTLQRNHLVLLDEQLYERPSLRNYRSTYYHELGHVATRDSHWLTTLHQTDWPTHWGREVLADLYLFWRLLREGAEDEELWAQLHLRNIGLMQAQPDWLHWTTPVLYPLLQDIEQLRVWSHWPLPQFLNAAFDQQQQWPLQAYRRLGQKQFALTASSVTQPYLSAPQRQQWQRMLTPTLQWLGVDLPHYLQRHQLN